MLRRKLVTEGTQLADLHLLFLDEAALGRRPGAEFIPHDFVHLTLDLLELANLRLDAAPGVTDLLL